MSEDKKVITQILGEFNLYVDSFEQIHPNGVYVIETNTVHENTLYTSGYHDQLKEYLLKAGLVLDVFVVYPDHISFIIKS